MNEDDLFKDFDTTPKLTFEPIQQIDEGKTQVVTANQSKQVENMPRLSPEEQKMVDDFASQIDITNSNMVLQYGAGSQKKMSDFSETVLSNVKSKDLGEVGNMLTNLVTELKSFDVQEEDKGFLGFFKKQSNKMTSIKAKYNSAEANVNKVCEELEKHQIQLLKDIAMLDKMYEVNKAYFKEISMYILAGKKKLNEVETNDLAQAQRKAEATGLPEDAQAAQDLGNLCNRFEKKLYDLELTRTISIQTAPQIRMIQNNDTIMAEKIQSTIVNTIPLWKNQMVLALGVYHSGQAAKAQREVTDMTNELLRKNASALKLATVETAKESERGIVDIDTLKNTNATLISTLDEVLKIQNEGRQKRKEAEIELNRMENELKQKILEVSRAQRR